MCLLCVLFQCEILLGLVNILNYFFHVEVLSFFVILLFLLFSVVCVVFKYLYIV